MASTGSPRGKFEPRTNDERIIKMEKKLAEAKYNNKPEMVEFYQKELNELKAPKQE